ncbi:hypothetical protein [Stigmatella erecta]|uniref:Uncharacterized protein n=1 Tax=Stigmatella erecta TaxID=83460 RepID=A0A1I0KPT9_9BACT|nr:hypothetical protein [Stigmatella erecta]SEU26575.1 hypothetical protein SAMN05443639_112119 [Stigmatella erecta]
MKFFQRLGLAVSVCGAALAALAGCASSQSAQGIAVAIVKKRMEGFAEAAQRCAAFDEGHVLPGEGEQFAQPGAFLHETSGARRLLATLGIPDRLEQRLEALRKELDKCDASVGNSNGKDIFKFPKLLAIRNYTQELSKLESNLDRARKTCSSKPPPDTCLVNLVAEEESPLKGVSGIGKAVQGIIEEVESHRNDAKGLPPALKNNTDCTSAHAEALELATQFVRARDAWQQLEYLPNDPAKAQEFFATLLKKQAGFHTVQVAFNGIDSALYALQRRLDSFESSSAMFSLFSTTVEIGGFYDGLFQEVARSLLPVFNELGFGPDLVLATICERMKAEPPASSASGLRVAFFRGLVHVVGKETEGKPASASQPVQAQEQPQEEGTRNSKQIEKPSSSTTGKRDIVVEAADVSSLALLKVLKDNPFESPLESTIEAAVALEEAKLAETFLHTPPLRKLINTFAGRAESGTPPVENTSTIATAQLLKDAGESVRSDVHLPPSVPTELDESGKAGLQVKHPEGNCSSPTVTINAATSEDIKTLTGELTRMTDAVTQLAIARASGGFRYCAFIAQETDRITVKNQLKGMTQSTDVELGLKCSEDGVLGLQVPAKYDFFDKGSSKPANNQHLSLLRNLGWALWSRAASEGRTDDPPRVRFSAFTDALPWTWSKVLEEAKWWEQNGLTSEKLFPTRFSQLNNAASSSKTRTEAALLCDEIDNVADCRENAPKLTAKPYTWTQNNPSDDKLWRLARLSNKVLAELRAFRIAWEVAKAYCEQSTNRGCMESFLGRATLAAATTSRESDSGGRTFTLVIQ